MLHDRPQSSEYSMKAPKFIFQDTRRTVTDQQMLSVKQKAKDLSGSHLENKSDVTVRKYIKYGYSEFRSLCLSNSHSDSDIEKNTFIGSFEPGTFGLTKF